MAFTYLIQSEIDQSYYAGITERQPKDRLTDHNTGILKTTAVKRPWKLVYYREHPTMIEARQHEKWLKKKSRDYKSRLAQLAPPEIGGVK